MKPTRNTLIALLLALFLCCWAVGSIHLPTPNPSSGGREGLSGGMQSGAQPPSGGNCANTGVVMEDNPFTGWPVARFVGDWKTISAWYCDPQYFAGYTHWGIDLAARVTASEWQSIDHAEVICTADLAVVAAAADDGGAHYGMGNHVILNEVSCKKRCGNADEQPAENHWLFLLAADSSECPLPTPIPDPAYPDEPTPEPEYRDLLWDCTESGWKAAYMHLFDVAVQRGALVERGRVVGQIDNTGNSTGPHLHYQINGPGYGAIDPAPAMCEAYSNALLDTYRWERPVCPDYGS